MYFCGSGEEWYNRCSGSEFDGELALELTLLQQWIKLALACYPNYLMAKGWIIEYLWERKSKRCCGERSSCGRGGDDTAAAVDKFGRSNGAPAGAE